MLPIYIFQIIKYFHTWLERPFYHRPLTDSMTKGAVRFLRKSLKAQPLINRPIILTVRGQLWQSLVIRHCRLRFPIVPKYISASRRPQPVSAIMSSRMASSLNEWQCAFPIAPSISPASPSAAFRPCRQSRNALRPRPAPPCCFWGLRIFFSMRPPSSAQAFPRTCSQTCILGADTPSLALGCS